MSAPPTFYRKTGMAAEFGFWLMVAGVPFALGSVHQSTQIATTLLATALFALVWYHRHTRRAKLRLSWFAIMLSAVTVYTALQLVPLPMFVLRLLAPATVDLLHASLADAGGMPSWHPISLDPSATLWALMRMLACTLTFVAAHNFVYRRKRGERLLAVLAGAGAVQVLLALAGAIVAPERPLLLYTPHVGWSGGQIVTSFVNPNHSAAYLTISAIAAVGLALAQHDFQRKLLYGFIGIAVGSGVFLTTSRGGMFGLSCGMASLTILIYMFHDNRRRRLSLAMLVPGALAVILGVSAWLGYDAIVRPYQAMVTDQGVDLGKVHLWPSGLAMVLDNPLVGTGRGTFLTAFPRYLSGDFPRVTFSHLENQYLHLPAEWGIPVALLLLVSSAVAFICWLRWGRFSALTMAAASALLALAIHNIVDFNLEILGVAIPAAVLAAMVSSQAAHSRRRDSEGLMVTLIRHFPLSKTAVMLTALGSLAFCVWMAVAAPPTVEEDLRNLNKMGTKGVALKDFETSTAAAIRRHPSSYVLHLSLGRYYLAAKKSKALSSLNRALLLFPQSPQVHLEVAKTLRAFGRNRQAILEYRLAMTYGDHRRSTLAEALTLCKDWPEIKALLPQNEKVMWRALRLLLSRARGDKAGELLTVAASLAAHASALYPKDERLALAEMEVATSWVMHECTRKDRTEGGCAKMASETLATARNTAKSHPGVGSYLQWSKAALLAGDRQEATQVLVDGRKKFPLQLPLAFALSRHYLDQKKLTEAETVARQVLGQANRRSEMAAAHQLLARIMRAGNRRHTEQYHLKKARTLRGQ